MRGTGLATVGWSAFAALLVAASALLLPACGLRLGPIDVARCAPPARAAAAVSPRDELDDLLLQVHALEDALVARPVCEVPVRQAEAPVVGQELALPEGGDDLTFLEGCWASAETERIVEGRHRSLVRIEYCFASEDGIGEVTYEGPQIGTCRADLQARRSGDAVVMEYEQPRCGDGRRYHRGRVTCRRVADSTRCDLVAVRQDGSPAPEHGQFRNTVFRRVR